jgi:hypothetical protein
MQPNQESFTQWRAPLPPRKVQPLDLGAERAELARQQTVAVKLKNAIAAGDFIATADITKAVETLFAVVRENVLVLPGKIADTVASYAPQSDRAAIYQTLHGECRSLLVTLSTVDAMGAAVQKKMAAAEVGDVDEKAPT